MRKYRLHDIFDKLNGPFSPLKGLSILLVLFLMLFGLFSLHTDVGRGTDPYITGFIATVFVVICTAMVIGTKEWTWRGLGALAVFTGDAALYGYIAINGVTAITFLEKYNEASTDIIRSWLVLGGILLLTSMSSWWYNETVLKDRFHRIRTWIRREKHDHYDEIEGPLV